MVHIKKITAWSKYNPKKGWKHNHIEDGWVFDERTNFKPDHGVLITIGNRMPLVITGPADFKYLNKNEKGHFSSLHA